MKIDNKQIHIIFKVKWHTHGKIKFRIVNTHFSVMKIHIYAFSSLWLFILPPKCSCWSTAFPQEVQYLSSNSFCLGTLQLIIYEKVFCIAHTVKRKNAINLAQNRRKVSINLLHSRIWRSVFIILYLFQRITHIWYNENHELNFLKLA